MTRVLTLRVPGSLARRLQELAARDRRSLNSFLRLELERLVGRRSREK